MLSGKLVFLAILLKICSGALPPFIHPCHINDSECLAREASSTLRHLKAGNKELKIIPLEPLYFETVQMDGGKIGVKLSKLNVYGISNAEIKEIKFHTTAKSCEINFLFPYVELIGDYEISGKVLMIPISGKGKENITAGNTEATWKFTYDLQDKDGKKYLKILTDETKVKITQLHVYFADFFPDEAFNKRVNEILNDGGWHSFVEDIEPAIVSIFGKSVRMVTEHVFHKYPFEELILV